MTFRRFQDHNGRIALAADCDTVGCVNSCALTVKLNDIDLTVDLTVDALHRRLHTYEWIAKTLRTDEILHFCPACRSWLVWMANRERAA